MNPMCFKVGDALEAAELLHTFHDTAFQAFVDAKPGQVKEVFRENLMNITLGSLFPPRMLARHHQDNHGHFS